MIIVQLNKYFYHVWGLFFLMERFPSSEGYLYDYVRAFVDARFLSRIGGEADANNINDRTSHS